MMKCWESAVPGQVRLEDPFFKVWTEKNRLSTLPSALRKCRESGRIDAFRLNWKEGMANKPHPYWDSDVAKVLEGMAYELMTEPDRELEKELEEIVALIVSSQGTDGYLNSYYSVVEPEKRWKDLAYGHELYCAGHLMEAAVAHFQATGRRNFLDCMCRCADYIASVFGRGEGRIRGYPGHPEIELALCRLAKATGRKRYLELAKFFIDERGREPRYYACVEGIENETNLKQLQAHRPLREQNEAVGHAVRAVYLYSGMADVAAATDDAELLDLCRTLFRNIAERKMYITGGIGATREGEAFLEEWNLPNAEAYAESCAAIGLVFFAERMLNITGDSCYADVMERVLYNGALSGIGLSGDVFYYANPLEMNPGIRLPEPYSVDRRPWFSCSCCPTNCCRFLPGIATRLWSVKEETEDKTGAAAVRLNIPAASVYDDSRRRIRVSGAYPYDGRFEVLFESDFPGTFSFRIPEYCGGAFQSTLNGRSVRLPVDGNGYALLKGMKKKGDCLEVNLNMPVRVMRSHPSLLQNHGKIALTRGPLVYALESADNPPGLERLLIPADQSFQTLPAASGSLPPGTLFIRGTAFREKERCADSPLYSTDSPDLEKGTFTALPYALRQNRGGNEMILWVREKYSKDF